MAGRFHWSSYGSSIPRASMCQPDEVGEMVLRGPLVMNGYHNRPALNAEKFRGRLVSHR